MRVLETLNALNVNCMMWKSTSSSG